ncbi:aspartate kinase [Aureibacter tunicatorum]|uniref:Aspartokinase n=1 Tax=Aureibacter tunicatorum TaxID=866807 RepID=A0AAE3XLU7_9BACT|nr:aspartate kinase [Aureibacter tunicatorum]MDR6237319.1 aspartate kinase [Aureibacter tunicatorum]BDD06310.1 aspartokinase [Aureibacter tunicatorum]
MKVLKFGGTSVGSPKNMHQVASLITDDSERKVIVLSAVSGTTNALVEIGERLFAKDHDKASMLIAELHEKYKAFYPDLLKESKSHKKAKQVIDEHFAFINSLVNNFFNKRLNNELLAQGEMMSTKLFSIYLEEKNCKSKLISALDFMAINEEKEPIIEFTTEHLSQILDENAETNIFVTQGFICRNEEGEIDNLQRGGSDYSATIIGAAVQAEEVQIWTDIDGMHNNDPRFVDNTFPIADLSFDEASELAYFGAKILHPTSIVPAQKYEVPVRLKNTMDPAAYGTLISKKQTSSGIKAIASKDGITAIKIKSSRMLMAYGFLKKVFSVFEKYKTPIDMITTSEVAVSLTIDNDEHLDQIVAEIEEYGTVIVDKDQSIICAAGNFKGTHKGIVSKIFDALVPYPIRMISFGGSDYNVSMLVDTKYKQEILIKLNNEIFLNAEF